MTLLLPKKVLEVFSVHKTMKKMLPPDCNGHFSLSPSLTKLPLSTFFKHYEKKFPFQAHLFFKPEDLSSSLNRSSERSPPQSLTQSVVTIMEVVVELSAIVSPYFDDVEIDVSNSENLINIPLDDYLGRIEVAIVTIEDPIAKNKLYSDTCIIHEKINFSKIKYYHESRSEQSHMTQTFLYGSCQSRGRTGMHMELPSWAPTPTQSNKVC